MRMSGKGQAASVVGTGISYRLQLIYKLLDLPASVASNQSVR